MRGRAHTRHQNHCLLCLMNIIIRNGREFGACESKKMMDECETECSQWRYWTEWKTFELDKVRADTIWMIWMNTYCCDEAYGQTMTSTKNTYDKTKIERRKTESEGNDVEKIESFLELHWTSEEINKRHSTHKLILNIQYVRKWHDCEHVHVHGAAWFGWLLLC